VRVLRALLALLPSGVRQEYGAELLRTVEEQWAEVGGTLGVVSRSRFWRKQWWAIVRVSIALRRGSGILGAADRRALLRRRRANARHATLRPIVVGTAVESWLMDVRHAGRVLVQGKGWTIVVLFSLAVGIGANTALFSGVNALLLRTIPAAEPERLVRLHRTGQTTATSTQEYGTVRGWAEGAGATFPFRVFQELSSAKALSGLFACAPLWGLNVVLNGQGENASVLLASGQYFDVLGIRAARGRVFGKQDDHPSASPVAVVSHGFWRDRLGGSPAAMGQVVLVGGVPFTIVGVLPRDYAGVQHTLDTAADIHIPLAMDRLFAGQTRLDQPGAWWLEIMGRLDAQATLEQASAELAHVFAASLPSASPSAEASGPVRLRVEPGLRGIYDADPSVTKQAQMLGVVVVLLLLIVCANVSMLLVTRATSRQREMAVRQSVGASRRRLMRQLVTEGLVVSGIGGGLGVLVALATRQLLPFAQTAPFDWRVFVFALGLSVACGMTFSVLPALRATRIELSGALKRGDPRASRARSGLSRALLVAQVAVSLVLLIGAGLFGKTLRHLRQVEVGFEATNVLVLSLDASQSGYDDARVASVQAQIQERLEALPGAVSVGIANQAFLSGAYGWTQVYLDAREELEFEQPFVMTASRGFFGTMQVPLISGRLFDERDRKGGAHVVVINAAAARAWYGGESAVGRHLGTNPSDHTSSEIIGVVGDVRSAGARVPAPPTLYLAYTQAPTEARTFVVRTKRDPHELFPAVRRAVRDVDPSLPVLDLSTQAEQIEERLADERVIALTYSLFGSLATLLAAIGLFGLTSYDVVQRRHEFGVRRALGASSPDIARLVARQSLTLVALGGTLGVLGSLAASGAVAHHLFGIAPTDAGTILQGITLMSCVSLAAAYLPARRASRIDPTIALRHD
jgi:predicted permease